MRNKRAKFSSHEQDRFTSSARYAPELRYGRLRRLAFAPVPPPALRTFAVGAATPMTVWRVASEDKVAAEALRSLLRARAGFPVTQPGMFAALTRFASRDRDAFLALAVAGLDAAA